MPPVLLHSPRRITSAVSYVSRSARGTLRIVSNIRTTTTENFRVVLPTKLTVREAQTTTSIPPAQTNSSGLSPVEVGAIFVGSFFFFLLIVTLILLYLQFQHGRQYFSSSFFKLGRAMPNGSAVAPVQAHPPYTSPAPALPPMAYADDHGSLRGFGRLGYNPVESHLRLQRDDPTMVPKVGGLTRFIVGERLAHNFAVKAAGSQLPSTLSDSDKSSSAPPHHPVTTHTENPSNLKKSNKFIRFKFSFPAWMTPRSSTPDPTRADVLHPSY